MQSSIPDSREILGYQFNSFLILVLFIQYCLSSPFLGCVILINSSGGSDNFFAINSIIYLIVTGFEVPAL